MSYDEFKEFYDKHPDLDNTEYYTEFPETNKSTIRSWKAKLKQPEIPTPPPPEDKGIDDEMVKLLCNQTQTPYNEVEELDVKSALIVLKAKLRNIQLQQQEQEKMGAKADKTSNTSILPIPAPIGQNKKQFGLDPYITFDTVKDEIRMEIPWDVLMDPEKNKKLGEIK